MSLFQQFSAGNYRDTALNCERIAGEITRILIKWFRFNGYGRPAISYPANNWEMFLIFLLAIYLVARYIFHSALFFNKNRMIRHSTICCRSRQAGVGNQHKQQSGDKICQSLQ
jgi:hypothetical protein